MDDLKKAIITSLNDSKKTNYKKELKETKEEIKRLNSERRKTNNKTFFDEISGRELKSLRRKKEKLSALDSGRLVVNVNGKDFYIKKDYLAKQKNPEKIVRGYYARNIRKIQKKAYDSKDYNAVVNLGRKLKGLNEKQGLSTYKINKARKSKYDHINKYFKSNLKDGFVKLETNFDTSPQRELVSMASADEVNILYV